MSYQSRQKKRQHKRTAAKARQKRSPDAARRWFLTVAKHPGRYACCGRRFDRGAEIVYRHEPREIRCVGCAERDPESSRFSASQRWESRHGLPKAA